MFMTVLQLYTPIQKDPCPHQIADSIHFFVEKKDAIFHIKKQIENHTSFVGKLPDQYFSFATGFVYEIHHHTFEKHFIFQTNSANENIQNPRLL